MKIGILGTLHCCEPSAHFEASSAEDFRLKFLAAVERVESNSGFLYLVVWLEHGDGGGWELVQPAAIGAADESRLLIVSRNFQRGGSSPEEAFFACQQSLESAARLRTLLGSAGAFSHDATTPFSTRRLHATGN